MNKILKIITMVSIIIIFILGFSNSYTSLNIDRLAYVLAIGIDTASDNKLEVSFQFSEPIASTESGPSSKTSPILNTVTASSLSNAINLVNGYIGKEINMSHCKVIIFSEEIAEQGIKDEIYTLINDTQVRPSSNIVISKCSAKYYMNQTNPELEILLSKYYETFTDSSKYTGYMPDATIGGFFNSLTCGNSQPYGILGGVQLDTNNQQNEEINSQKDYSVKSNSSSISGQNGAENIGVAVFKDDKLVGELDALETIAFLNIKNQIERFLISVPDPENNNNYLDIYISPIKRTNITVDTSTPTPHIKVDFSFSGRIYSMTDNSKYLSPEVLEEISKSCNSYLDNVFTEYLYRTAKEFESDINNIGLYSLINFFTTKETEEYDWHECYKNSFFDVNVDTSIKSGMLITET